MLKTTKQMCIWLLIVCCIVGFSGCTNPPEVQAPDYILKTSVMVVSKEDFIEELDLKLSAYPYNIKDNTDEYNQMVIHLLKVLSEELILLSEASQKGILISDQQVDLAESDLKNDYPEDSFEQMLLKNAISYPFWKKRFKKNMILDKLIDQELKQKIEISSQDIVDFYKKHGKEKSQNMSEKGGAAMNFQDEKQLVARLRLQKTQDSYDAWMQELWKKYPVDVDNDKLKTFLIDIETPEGK